MSDALSRKEKVERLGTLTRTQAELEVLRKQVEESKALLREVRLAKVVSESFLERSRRFLMSDEPLRGLTPEEQFGDVLSSPKVDEFPAGCLHCETLKAEVERLRDAIDEMYPYVNQRIFPVGHENDDWRSQTAREVKGRVDEIKELGRSSRLGVDQ